MALIEVFLPKIENKILAKVKDTVLIFSFALLTGVFAKIKVEIGPVPITMQTLAVLLSGSLLGAKRGALSQILYLLFGLGGIPWFSRGGGISYVFSPTFGYIVGFVFCAFFVGFLVERGFGKSFSRLVLAMIFGEIFLYLFGIFWLAKFFSFKRALAVGLYPFLIGDFLKIFLASFICSFFGKLIKRKK